MCLSHCVFRFLTKFGETFSKIGLILGYRYNRKQKVKSQLLNCITGTAKMVIYISMRNYIGGSRDNYPKNDHVPNSEI